MSCDSLSMIVNKKNQEVVAGIILKDNLSRKKDDKALEKARNNMKTYSEVKTNC